MPGSLVEQIGGISNTLQAAGMRDGPPECTTHSRVGLSERSVTPLRFHKMEVEHPADQSYLNV